MNFYDLMFSAAPANLSELRTVFQSISGAMKGNVKCPGDLASFFLSFSGQDIIRHGYQFYAIPTWHHTAISFPTSNFTRPTRVSPDDFSIAVRYLRTPTHPGTVALTQPTGTCQTDASHGVTVTFDSGLNRVRPDDRTPYYPSLTSDFILFSESLHLYPKVYVFTLTGSSVDAWDATAFGLVIESADLDGTVIPVPNPDLSLGIENTWFSESAIPLRNCYWSIMFDTSATTSFARAMNRTIAPRQTRFPAGSLLNDRTKIRIPRYNANSSPMATTHLCFPGLTPTNNVNWSTWIQNFLGFRTADNRSHLPTDDVIPGMTRQLLVWSPYTFVGYEGEEEFDADFEKNHTYFITNFRTIFGTDVPLIEVTNGLDAMPIA